MKNERSTAGSETDTSSVFEIQSKLTPQTSKHGRSRRRCRNRRRSSQNSKCPQLVKTLVVCVVKLNIQLPFVCRSPDFVSSVTIKQDVDDEIKIKSDNAIENEVRRKYSLDTPRLHRQISFRSRRRYLANAVRRKVDQL